MNFFPRCDFVRVIVATTLFGRLVDLENISEILEEFSQVCSTAITARPFRVVRRVGERRRMYKMSD